ncbi:MAG: hypothetical protein Q9227_001481 [Pyrenula ochraceoflavens]
MPTRAAPQQTAANTKNRVASANLSRASNTSRSDDWDSGGTSASNNLGGPNATATTASNTRTSSDVPRHQSINSISRFSFASIAPATSDLTSTSLSDTNEDLTRDSVDGFEQTINFDDFHESITNTEPSLNSFPMPNSGGSIPVRSLRHKPTSEEGGTAVGNTNRKFSGTNSVGRAASLSRRLSSGSNALSRSSSKTETAQSMAAAAVPKFRGRRQTNFPPNSFNNTSTNRAPRKSVGPGTFAAPDGSENESSRRRPSIGARASSDENQNIPGGLSVRQINQGSEKKAPKSLRVATNPRNMKAKSLQPPPRSLAEPDEAGSNGPKSPVLSPHSPGRSTHAGNATPSSAKRMSVMPHHATGLGARTISPTDARRMKRMSTMPPAPPIPQNYNPKSPPTPHFDPSTAQSGGSLPSPALNARKSVTPSSSRTTPDPNRKSYSSGQSLSSSTSYGSVRNSTVGASQRISQNPSSSRLPTPKPRQDGLSTTAEEDVPPVPAIPKAYESPHSEVDQPFFSTRSSSLPQVDSPYASPITDSYVGLPGSQTPIGSLPSSRKSSLNPETDQQPSRKQAQNVSKKNLQPVRLPPINLLPLSTPTSAKIKALEAPLDEDRPLTPPKRVTAKTPSTPMTASKSSFFGRFHKDSETVPINTLRSSSSHFVLRPDSSSYRPPSSSSSHMQFGFDGHGQGLRTISPFVSSSVPKSSGEFSNYMRSKYANTSSIRVNGPRAQTNASVSKEESLSPSENDGTLSGLRRKLSLTRKRSASKSRDNNNVDPDPVAYDNMPPPRLPASATWGNFAPKSSSPTAKPSYLRSRRKASASSVTSNPTREQNQSISSEHSFKIEGRPSLDSINSRDFHPNRSSSLLAPAQISVKTKSGSIAGFRQQSLDLDRDDLAAEDEMKKLGSKRKDFESAARELDSLYERAHPRQCVTPAQALMHANLNIFERGEIVDYSEVYFTGTRHAQKVVGDLNAASANFGYDDERGDYNIVEGDHLAYRYEVVDLLGKGSFGQVVRCIDHKTGLLVAVKIIRNKKRFHQQALVEVNILQKLKEWDPQRKHSVVNFDQSFYFRGHLCISTDLLGMNLYEFIKAHDFRGFSLKLIRRFTKQLLSTLVLLHSHRVIHCDLKPENVLLAHPLHSEIKVIDFGSSCFENEKVYTYIQSRFYRSPEVILGMAYGMPIDMWSVGCILAELFTGYPIFPGENEQEQLACIMEVFGPPERHLIDKSSRKKLFFDSMGKPRLTVSSKGRRRRPSSKDLRQALKCDDEPFLDFLARCLRWDPARRMNPQEAMCHEFITGQKNSINRRPAPVSVNGSPLKRIGSVNGPAGARPLPQPPATALKNGNISKPTEAAANSPIKTAVPKRHSTVNGLQTPLTSKRTPNGAAMSSTSSLPRVTQGQRSVSGKPDLATAAAATSLVR